jgi:type II secretory pathway pseudopilin PulG
MDVFTPIVSLLAAIIGGWIAGHYALRAQKQAAEDQRQASEEAEHRAVKHTLRAIKTELEGLQKAFVNGTDERLKNWEEQYKKQVPLNLPSITQNYFIVFDSSAAALGGIENDELRQRILATFYQAKILIEAINYQHQRYQSYEPLAYVPGTAEMQALKDDLLQWADKVIRGRLEPLQKNVSGLLEDIQKFLDS